MPPAAKAVVRNVQRQQMAAALEELAPGMEELEPQVARLPPSVRIPVRIRAEAEVEVWASSFSVHP
jgi:hypothetical protein